jgi:hypothetical protein
LQAFDTENELLSYYDSLNSTGNIIHAVVFEDLPPNGSLPDHLKYKIRISEILFHTADLLPEFSPRPNFFGKDVRMFSKHITYISFTIMVNTFGVLGKIQMYLKVVEKKGISH